uniref:Ig-like domain-containing protein n=1 Tax=Terrapene triunguis TaxID=2587831 RepID=A0A674JPV8_9SAUR
NPLRASLRRLPFKRREAKGLTGPGEVGRPLGESVSVQCQYHERYQGNRKYWCRGTVWRSCHTAVKTTGSEGRVSITDNHTTRTFTVTMENLTLEDAGIYWCGINIKGGGDPYFLVNVTVLPAEAQVSWAGGREAASGYRAPTNFSLWVLQPWSTYVEVQERMRGVGSSWEVLTTGNSRPVAQQGSGRLPACMPWLHTTPGSSPLLTWGGEQCLHVRCPQAPSSRPMGAAGTVLTAGAAHGAAPLPGAAETWQ